MSAVLIRGDFVFRLPVNGEIFSGLKSPDEARYPEAFTVYGVEEMAGGAYLDRVIIGFVSSPIRGGTDWKSNAPDGWTAYGPVGDYHGVFPDMESAAKFLGEVEAV